MSEQLGDPSPATDAGTVYLFTLTAGIWSSNQKLISSKPTSNFNFGGYWVTSSVQFSPDSNTIAIGESGGNNGQLFTRSGVNWNHGPVLSVSGSGSFGIGLSFSASGTILAIGGYTGDGNVYLFTQSGANWTLNRTVSALVPTRNNGFGFSVFFSPVGTELAVYEYRGDTPSAMDAGVVSVIDISQLP